VTEKVLFDNARALVVDHDTATRTVVFNDKLKAFAKHWGFRPREQRPSVLWWCYLALYVALFCLIFVNFVLEGLFESFGAAFLSWAILSSDAVSIIGLYAYLRSTPLFAPAFLAGYADAACGQNVRQCEFSRPQPVSLGIHT
jgi:hypothetical protein